MYAFHFMGAFWLHRRIDMATTALSGGDLTLLRADDSIIDDMILNIVQPATVTTLTITAMPTTYPQSSVTVSGDMSDVVAGMRFKIHLSGTIKTWGIVRKAPSGSTLYINPTQLGEPGYPERIETAIAVSDTVVIYEDHPLVALYSVISNRIIYKNWDVVYTDENSVPPPIANAGEWQSGKDATSIDFVLPRGGVNNSFALGAATISTHLWTLPTGVTFKAGSASSDATPTVTATPGQYKITYTITDSNSKTHTAYTWLWVSDEDTTTSIGEQYSWEWSSREGLDGTKGTLVLYGDDLDETKFLPGAGVHIKEVGTFDMNSGAVTDGVIPDTFIGYITSMNATHDGDKGSITLEVVSPFIYAQGIAMPSQVLIEDATPANWQEVTSVLSNPRGVMTYFRWHLPALYSMHDIDGGGLTTPRRKAIPIQTNTIGSGLQSAANMITGNIGSAYNGTLVLRQDPVLEDTTFRDALATVHTFVSQDIDGHLGYQRRLFAPLQELRGGAFAFNGTISKAWYAIKNFAQGSGKASIPDFTIAMADGLTGVRERIGHAYAKESAEEEIVLRMQGHFDVCEPVYMVWYKLNLAASLDPRGDGFSNVRMLCTGVDRKYDRERRTKSVTNTFIQETFGQPGVELPIGKAAANMGGSSWNVSNIPIPFEQQQDSGVPNFAIVHDDTGKIALTYTYLDSNPEWFDLSDNFTGLVNDMCWNYNSSFFTSGNDMVQPLGMYVVSTSGTTLYVYQLDDLLLNPSLTEAATYTMSDSTVTTSARVQCSTTTPTFAAVAFKDQTGTRVGRTEDGGTTWETLVRAGTSVSDTGNDNLDIGFFIDDVKQVVTAPNSSLDYDLYIATAVDGAFSKMTGSVANTAPSPMIVPNYLDTTDDKLYVSTINDGTAAAVATVDFDGGYSNYTMEYSDPKEIDEDDDYTGVSGNAYGLTWGAGSYPDSGATIDEEGLKLHISFLSPNILCKKVTLDVKLDSYDWDSQGANQTIELRTVVHRYDDFVAPINLIDSDIQVIESQTKVSAGTAYDYSTVTNWTTVTHTFSTEETIEGLIVLFQPNITAGTLGVTANSNTVYLMDNVAIFDDNGVVDPELYRVDAYSTAPSWNNITPANNEIPTFPIGLGIDRNQKLNLEAMTQEGSTKKWYSSDDNGASWTDNGATSYRMVKRVGDVIIAGGEDALGLSVDNGVTFEDKRGDLSAAWNATIGTIKQILIVV